MTQAEIKEAREVLQNQWDYIRGHIDDRMWEMINTAVELELQLEAECGK